MQKLAIILSIYKLDHTPHCAQTMHHTYSYVLSFPLRHVLLEKWLVGLYSFQKQVASKLLHLLPLS